jgi:hypothetical protein
MSGSDGNVLTLRRGATAVSAAQATLARLARDEELREHLRNALALSGRASATAAAGYTLAPVRRRLPEDVGADFAAAIDELRLAAGRLRPRRSHAVRNTIVSLSLVGAVALGALFNPATGAQTRRRLRLALSGGGGGEPPDDGETGPGE